MNPDEARQVLFQAARLRVPDFGPDDLAATKVGKLEDYAIEASRTRGDLEEARLYMGEINHRFTVEWATMTGWEVGMPGGKRRRDATKDDITEAKRNARPDLWENISDMKHLVSQLSDQIRRIEKDEDRVSRLYTFITGS